MLLSIDVGIRNLAMCCLQGELIKQWEVAAVPSEREGGLLPALREHLEHRDWINDVKVVVIERQPDKNKKMKAIEHYLHGFFSGRGMNVNVFDAKYKIPDVVGSGRKQYTKRKNTSIERARDWITDNHLNSHWLDFFNSHSKKDDLADTVMQAIAFMDRKESSPNKPTPKLTARKPTPNQRETKYSKSNLVWLWKNEDQEKLKKNKRFNKDLKRYFHSIEELIHVK